MATSHIFQGLKKVKPTIHLISYQVHSGASIHPDILAACKPLTHVWSSTSAADGSNRHRINRNLFLTVLTEQWTLNLQGTVFLLWAPINLQSITFLFLFCSHDYIYLCIFNHPCICKRNQLNCGVCFFQCVLEFSSRALLRIFACRFIREIGL